jgi:hypothetical protein
MIWFIAGAALAYVVSAVLAGTLMQQQADRIRLLQAELFTMEQRLLDALEGQQYPKYIMSTEGVDPVVIRNRPDLEGMFHTKTVDDGTTIVDLTEVEDEV